MMPSNLPIFVPVETVKSQKKQKADFRADANSHVQIRRHIQKQLRSNHSTSYSSDKHLADLIRAIGNALHKDIRYFETFMYHRINQALEKGTSPPAHVYERLISFLLKQKRLRDAVNVYERMRTEEVVPTHLTQLQIAAISLAMSDPDDIHIERVVVDLVTDPKCNEQRFLQFLGIMAELGVKDDHLQRVTWIFIESRDEDHPPSPKLLSKLVDVQARSGQVDNAFETIQRYNSSLMPEPFAALIRSLTDTNLNDEATFLRVLDTMKVQQVTPDIDIFNALISRAIRYRNLGQAFTYYRHLVSLSVDSEVTLIPNEVTYSILFRFIAKVFSSKMRKARVRSYRRSPNVIPPRHLFRDLLFFYEESAKIQRREKKRPRPLSIPILNLALRAFLQVYDYPAAAVVLSVFKKRFLSPDTRTYLSVIRHIIRHSQLNFRFDTGKWATCFFNGSCDQVESPPLQHIIDSDEEDLTKKILEAVRGKEYRLVGSLFHEYPRSKWRYWVPMPKLLTSSKVLDGGKYDSEPLQRLLERAIIAQMESSKGTTETDEKENAGDSELTDDCVDLEKLHHDHRNTVTNVIEEAERDLLHGIQHPYKIPQDPPQDTSAVEAKPG